MLNVSYLTFAGFTTAGLGSTSALNCSFNSSVVFDIVGIEAALKAGVPPSSINLSGYILPNAASQQNTGRRLHMQDGGQGVQDTSTYLVTAETLYLPSLWGLPPKDAASAREAEWSQGSYPADGTVGRELLQATLDINPEAEAVFALHVSSENAALAMAAKPSVVRGADAGPLARVFNATICAKLLNLFSVNETQLGNGLCSGGPFNTESCSYELVGTTMV